MKKLILTTIAIVSIQIYYSQVAIGKNTVNGTQTILDFGTDNLGIILPAVDKVSSVTATNGTFVFDRNDLKPKVYENNVWKSLTTQTGALNAPELDVLKEYGEGVIFGANSSTADGVLVLESNNKAMILPIVDNAYSTISNPEAGMLVYDSINKTICIYDGARWAFWGK